MGSIRLVKPVLPAVVSGSMIGSARVVTPDPKEAAYSGGGGVQFIDFDFGANVTYDTVFVGYTNLPNQGAGSAISLQDGNGSPTENSVGSYQAAPGDGQGLQHFLSTGAPRSARYLRISQQDMPAGTWIGIVAVGLAFVPTWGQEQGAGRTIDDTGSADRLFGGGFGIDEGTVVTGYRWTFGELIPDEVRALYAQVRYIGLTKSVLLIEDQDFTAGLNERLHWGLLLQIQPYERFAPGATRWALTIGDWA